MEAVQSRRGTALTCVAWVWAGLVLGVSFVATPVKFLAPSLSLADAMEVGRVTFTALQWIECAAVLGMAALLYLDRSRGLRLVLFGVVAAVLAGEYLWLLPILDARVETILQGQDLPPSALHWGYTVIEGIKVLLLIALGWLSARARDRGLVQP